MVWIHGGGFVMGDGGDRQYGAEYLLDRDVILVTFNYRLGPLGSLNVGIEGAQGNQALWDQRQALMWVQRNIRAFGGNPLKVTLFGESAGAMSGRGNECIKRYQTLLPSLVRKVILYDSTKSKISW